MDNYLALFQDFEDNALAPYALKSRFSKGRKFKESSSDTRTCFQRDRDRIIHSKAFRRLREKTQVFIATESDHYRSRLTHSIEVAQISRHIARLMFLNEDVSEAIAFAHDLGHTPFGHAGEKVLNECLKDVGGFEHNLQSLRIVEKLEKKYPLFDGLNLSFEVTEGLKKHQTPWDHPEQDSLTFVSIEAQVVNVADQIAYNNHDIDDGLSSKLIDHSHLMKDVSLWRESVNYVKETYQNLDLDVSRSLCISHIISQQVSDVVKESMKKISQFNVSHLSDVQGLDESIVCFSKEMEEKSRELRHFLFNHFYTHPKIYTMNKKGQHIIKSLYHLFSDDIALLPKENQRRILNGACHKRIVGDYISSMTDPFAEKLYHSLF